MLYQMGWRAGAGCHAIPDRMKNERAKEYHVGYADGREAYRQAMVAARERLGAPPPSILRSQSAADIERQSDEEFFASLERG